MGVDASTRPDLADLRAAAEDGNERAARELEKWSDRERARKRLAACMGSASVFVVRSGEGLEVVEAPQLPRVAVTTGRHLAPDGSDPLDRGISLEDDEAPAMVPPELVRYLGDEPSPVSEIGRPPKGERRKPARRRISVEAMALDGGVDLLMVGGRPLRADWLADPQRTAERVALCGSGATIYRHGARHGAAPLGCGVASCPQCAHRKGGQWLGELHPLCMELARAGCTPVHLTLTQRVSYQGDAPTLLTDAERRSGVWAPGPVETADGRHVGYAVPGRSLSASVDSILEAWRRLRNRDKRAAAHWSETVAGYIYAVEVTGRGYRCRRCRGEVIKPSGHCPTCKDATGVWIPRWHVHLHVLAMLRPGVEVEAAPVKRQSGRTVSELDKSGAWMGRVVADWMRCVAHVGAEAGPGGQCGVRLGGSSEDVSEALQEVIKYPAKVSELTRAQVLEWLAVRKGANHHLTGGCLHGKSRIGRLVRELEAMADEPERVTAECVVLLGEDAGIDWSALPDWWPPVVAALIRARVVVEGDGARTVYLPADSEAAHRPTDVIAPVEGVGPVRWQALTLRTLETLADVLGPDHELPIGVLADDGSIEDLRFVEAGALLVEVTRWFDRGSAPLPASRSASSTPQAPDPPTVSDP